MKLAKLATLLLAFSIPSISFGAEQWSACHTVTGVTNFLGYNSTNPSVWVAVSPAISTCTSGVTFALQQLASGSTVETLKALLGSVTAAQLSGTRLMLYYDTTSCTGTAVAVGGYSGQCN
jgi:hypothetical protein